MRCRVSNDRKAGSLHLIVDGIQNATALEHADVDYKDLDNHNNGNVQSGNETHHDLDSFKEETARHPVSKTRYKKILTMSTHPTE